MKFNLNGKSKSAKTPVSNLGGGLAGLLHDLLTLTELQIKLFVVDSKAAMGRLVTPIALLAGATVLALCSIPLGLIAISQALRDQLGWAPALATLVALLIGLVVAGILGFIGYLLLMRGLVPMQRSRDELQRNVDWLKNAIRRYDKRTEIEGSPHDSVSDTYH